MRLTRYSLDTDADTLREWQKKLEALDAPSEFLSVRVEYNEQKQVLTQYIPHYVCCSKCGRWPDEHDDKKLRHNWLQPERVYPRFLPTQTSGRWSVKDPPKVTEPHPFQEDVILPDSGTAWICWDLDAIEAKLVAAESDDKPDLEAFDNGYDIHTITSCNMRHYPLPTDLRDPHNSKADAKWRSDQGWQGKNDKRYKLAKVRYCVLYGFDERAVDDSAYAADWVKQGGNRSELVAAAKLFLRSKPNLVACKRRWFDKCGRESESRTIFGRRRRLFGDLRSRQKEGWNHHIQGSVTDMVNTSIIELDLAGFPLVYPSHDAAKQVVRSRDLQSSSRVATLDLFHKAIVKTYVVNGYNVVTTATGLIKYPDGTHEDIIL